MHSDGPLKISVEASIKLHEPCASVAVVLAAHGSSRSGCVLGLRGYAYKGRGRRRRRRTRRRGARHRKRYDKDEMEHQPFLGIPVLVLTRLALRRETTDGRFAHERVENATVIEFPCNR